MIVWFGGAPIAEKMGELLCTESFSNKVASFINANIRAVVDDSQMEDIYDQSRIKDVSFLHPLNLKGA